MGTSGRNIVKTESWDKLRTNDSEGSDDWDEAALDPEPDEPIPAVVRATVHYHRSVHQLGRKSESEVNMEVG